MPIYEYGGKFYDLSEADPAAAKAKILAHLGEGGQKLAAPKEGMGAAFMGGLESLGSRLRTGAEAIFSPEEAARRGLERGEVISKEYAPGASLQRVKDVYAERGLLPAAGEAISQIPTAVAEQAPNIAATLAAGKAGAGAGAFVGGPIGAVIGGAAGAVAPSVLQLFGSNVERQAEVQRERGEPLDISRGKALAAAVPGAALEAASTFIPMGRTVVGKLLGPQGAKLLERGATETTEALAQESLKKVLAKGAGVGVAVEAPTEVVQQMLERAQAGLSLTSNEALAEYGEALYGAALVGGPFGAAGRAGQRAVARQELAAKAAPEELPESKAPKAAPEDIAQTYEALVSRYQAEGMSEIEALKAAGADIAQGGIDLGPMGTGAELEGAEQRTTGGAGVGVPVPQPSTGAPAATGAGLGRLASTEGLAGEAVSREGQSAGALTDEQINNLAGAGFTASQIEGGVDTVARLREKDPQGLVERAVRIDHANGLTTEEIASNNKVDLSLVQDIQLGLGLVPNEIVETPVAEAPAVAETPAAETPAAKLPAQDRFSDWGVITQEDDPNPFPEGMKFAVSAGAAGTLEFFKTKKEADNWLRQEIEFQKTLTPTAEAPAAKTPAPIAETPATDATTTEATTPTEVVSLEDVTVETPTSQLPVNPETGLKPKGKRGRPRIERTPEEQAAAEAQRKERQKVGRDAIRAVEKAQQTIAAPVDVEAIQRLAQTDKAAAVAMITEIQQGRDLALLEAARVLTDKKLSPTAKAKKVANAVFSHPSVTAEERQRAQRNAQLRDTAKNILVEGSTSFYPDSFYETVTDATQAANYISKKGNAFERLLINRIKPFLKGVKVVVVNDPRVDIPDPVARREFRGAAGLYAEGDGQRVIYLNNIGGRREGLTNMTFLHEAVHGATMAQINRFYKDPGSLSPQVVKAIQVLTEVMIRAGDHYNVLKKQGKTDPLEDRLNELEVFDDLKEFVAYGMTQPEMQDFLLKVPGFIQVRADRLNGLTAFVRAIQNMFGLGPQHNSAFQDLIIITDRIMGVDQLPAPTESVEVAAAKKVKAQNKTMEKIAKSQRAADVNAGLGELMMQTRNAKDAVRLLKSVYSALSISAVRKILPTMTTMDITRWVGDKINNIKVVNNAVEDMAGMRTKMIRELAEKTPQWIEFGRKFERGARTLGDVMHASTLLGIDPTQHADLATALKNDAQLKQLRVDYQAAIADPTKSPGQRSKLKGDVTKRENDLKAVYEGGVVQNPYTGEKYQIEGWTQLGKYGNGEGHRIFRMARDSYRDTFDLHQKLLTDKINKSGIPAASKAKLIAEITQGFQEAKQLGVYFPLMRYGNFWLRIGKGKSGEYHMFESAAARNNYARMRAEESGRTLDQALEAQEYDIGDNLDQIRNDVVESSRMLKSIFNALESNSTTDPTTGKVGITDVAAIKDQVYQMFLMTLPDRDMRKRFTHRQGKTGFSADVLRNFIVNQHTAANQLSRLAYADKIRLGIGSAYAELAGNPDKLKLSAFVDEIAMRAGAEMTPAIPNGFDWDKMASIGNQAVFYYMLTSPKSAIVQMTQLPVVGMPALLARYGLADTLKVTARYTNLFDKLGTTKRDQNGNVTTEWGEPSINDSSYVNKHPDPAYRRALRQAWQVAQDRDLFMSTYAADMTARAAVPTAKYQGWMGRGTRATLNFMGGAFHHLERLTREIMYMSTFELEFARAKKGGADDATATARGIKAATDMVYEALFNYSQYNKPRVMKANAATKIATQFMTYPLQMTSYLGRNFFNMLRSLPPQERKEAAIKFFGTMGMTTMFAGVVGLPGYSAILGLVEGLREAFRPDMEDEGADEYYDDDDDSNPLGKRSLDLWFREWFLPTYFGPGSSIANALGLTEAQALTLQRAVKMGPVSALTDLNIGASVSLDGLWFRDDAPAQSSKDAFTQFMFNFVMGPFGSMGQQIASAFDDFNNGQFNRGVEKILPAFFRGTAKAVRLASEGEQTRQGAEIRNAEWFTTGKLLGTALGFQSTEVAEIQKKNFLAKQIVVDVQRERQDTLDALDLALRRYENDPTDTNEQQVEKALKEVEQYNYKNGALPIDADTVQKSLEGRAKRRGAAIEGFIAGPKESAIARPILERTQVR